MAQPLTQFWPIFTCKSDGQEVVNLKGKILRNGPTEAQLDRTPNEQGISDYYRLLEKDDPKHMDWRKKLGGMLLREVGGTQYEDKWTQALLHDFPEGYRLYEHIKAKVNNETKSVKNHSGGGHDRQDAYLYGYPKGPKKRFRSPVEFFPHLLWLSTDEASDYQNCTCRICSPMQIEVEKPAPPAIKPEVVVSIKNEPQGRTPQVQIPLRRPSTGTPVTQSPVTKPAILNAGNPAPYSTSTPIPGPTHTPTPVPAPAAPQIKPPERKVATPLPQPRSHDQQVDCQYGKFVVRTGEVVWFHRESKGAWGLGLVARRWIPKDGSSDRAYLIQPLSHPYESPPQELITAEVKLKPWLAWSAPSCTYAFLQQNPTLSYDRVDWNTLLSGQYGDGIADVDACILAAKQVDTTYTLFERLKTQVVGGVEHRHWNGIFLGGEKIWNGDPVRLRLALGNDIMVVTDIVEKVYPVNQHNTASRISFTGDVYSYRTLPAPNPNALPQAPTSSSIPIRMREDLHWRNQQLVPATRTLAYWALVHVGTSVDVEEIKGRWYETSLLFVDYFQKSIKNNEGGNNVRMNARGDATGSGKILGTPRPSRLSAFGASIPKNMQLIEGLDPPNEHAKPNLTGMQGMDMSMVGGGNSDVSSFAFEDLLNLEGTDDAGMAFGQDFNFG
ncbi:hypothetical protein DM02DRAFT_646751 [Periconia macrospinosa]|uniref:Cryptic loci regulator 2 N-terminal domain-containing protein n=1 Tax=Periconia macrospinosa TaxID=97972 RepID=A0A2V1D415_9PLEO|nr:hypothetical protein DM02DRAFT_646751 [Periconia macrospinosa]